MPKMKTHSGASKRFKKRGKGLKFRHANRNHILTKKRTKRKRHLRDMGQIDASNEGAILEMLGEK